MGKGIPRVYPGWERLVFEIAEDSQKALLFIPEKHGESEFFPSFVKNPSNHTAFLMNRLVNFGRAGNILKSQRRYLEDFRIRIDTVKHTK